MSIGEADLQNYLLKCELQYRADHTEGAETLAWLAPYCRTVDSIANLQKGGTALDES